MELAALTYPFLFVTIFFESFIFVTFLSSPARASRVRVRSTETPTVAVIVPCLNEGETVARTTETLLALDYPADKLEIILVDNGSTDNTPEIMARYSGHPQVKALSTSERGKHIAVNVGIAATEAEFVGCLDADSFVEPDALREVIGGFSHPKVAAVTAAMSVHKPKNILQHMQNAEYIFGIALRHSLASVNGLYVTPGPFSFYRKSVIDELGGFRRAYNTEDMEMALRIQQAGYTIENALRARVYTKAPSTVFQLIKQRTRWTTGFMRNIFGEYWGLVGSRKHGVLGMIVLPVALTAIASGITLFFIAVYSLSKNVILAIQMRAGIPLSYSLMPHGSFSFDWFYAPVSVYLLLAIATILASLSLVAIGKKISNTPGNLALGFISYALIYGLIVPIWLIRATTDVVRGIERSWR